MKIDPVLIDPVLIDRAASAAVVSAAAASGRGRIDRMSIVPVPTGLALLGTTCQRTKSRWPARRSTNSTSPMKRAFRGPKPARRNCTAKKVVRTKASAGGADEAAADADRPAAVNQAAVNQAAVNQAAVNQAAVKSGRSESGRSESGAEPRRTEPDSHARGRSSQEPTRDRVDRESDAPSGHGALDDDDDFVEVEGEDEESAEVVGLDSAFDEPEHASGDSHDSRDHEHGDADEGDEDSEVVKAPREIPTWQEAIGVIVATNMESRARSPRGGGNSSYRGRNSSGPPRGNRPPPRDRGGHSGG